LDPKYQKGENHKIGPIFQTIKDNEYELEQFKYNWQNLRKLRLKIAKLLEIFRLVNCLAIAYFWPNLSLIAYKLLAYKKNGV